MRKEVNGFDKMRLTVDAIDHLPGIVKEYQLDLLSDSNVPLVVIPYIKRGKFK